MPFNPPVPGSFDQIISTFGDLRPYIQSDGTLSSKWESDQLTTFPLPFSMPLGGSPNTPVTHMRCHRLLKDVFLSAFTDIQNKGLAGKIQSYEGCYVGRAKRTSSHWSAHAWGIAIDINSVTNQQGTKGNMDPALIQVFEDHGFMWGGNFSGSSMDPMHFQYCTGY